MRMVVGTVWLALSLGGCSVDVKDFAGLACDEAQGLSCFDDRVCVAGVCQIPGSPVVNLLPNGSFESSLNGWKSYQGSLARESHPDAVDGSFVVRVTQQLGTTGGFSMEATPQIARNLVAGTSYTASVYVAAAVPSSVGRRVRAALRESSGSSFLNVEEKGLLLSNDFQLLSVTAVAQQSGNDLVFYVWQDSGTGADAFFADALSVERQDLLP